MPRSRRRGPALPVEVRLELVNLAAIAGCHSSVRHIEAVLAEVPFLIGEPPAVMSAGTVLPLLAAPLIVTPSAPGTFLMVANFRTLSLLMASGAECAYALVVENCDDAQLAALSSEALVLSSVLNGLGRSPQLMVELKGLIGQAQSQLVPVSALPPLKRRRSPRSLSEPEVTDPGMQEDACSQ